MSPLAWAVVTYIATRGTVDLTKAGLAYRTGKRNAEAKARTAEVKAS